MCDNIRRTRWFEKYLPLTSVPDALKKGKMSIWKRRKGVSVFAGSTFHGTARNSTTVPGAVQPSHPANSRKRRQRRQSRKPRIFPFSNASVFGHPCSKHSASLSRKRYTRCEKATQSMGGLSLSHRSLRVISSRSPRFNCVKNSQNLRLTVFVALNPVRNG